MGVSSGNIEPGSFTNSNMRGMQRLAKNLQTRERLVNIPSSSCSDVGRPVGGAVCLNMQKYISFGTSMISNIRSPLRRSGAGKTGEILSRWWKDIVNSLDHLKSDMSSNQVRRGPPTGGKYFVNHRVSHWKFVPQLGPVTSTAGHHRRPRPVRHDQARGELCTYTKVK